MRVLVVGSGGREHALVWKIARSPVVERVLAAPGSDGISRHADVFPEVKVGDSEALCALAKREGVDLVVVGPEDPLAAGLADALREAGIVVFGPSAAAARLEASKSFAKDFMRRHGIPTADSLSFSDPERALQAVREQAGRCVVKADGLAAGKGVFMCETQDQAEAALAEIMSERRFGEAGASVVIEDWMEGEEASYYAITDGSRIVTLAAAQDYKRAHDGDLGENTGGMGAYSPPPVLTPAVEQRVLERIVRPTIRGMAEEGVPYVGVLYVGLMIDAHGDPRVVEFNVRFGDPETQTLVVRMQSDLVPLLDAAARGVLDPDAPIEWGDAAVCVVATSGGYPRAYETGKPIDGLADAEADGNVVVFHAGTRGERGCYETAGGRVLGVTASGASVGEAQSRAYAAVAKVQFEAIHFRRDIAARAVDR